MLISSTPLATKRSLMAWTLRSQPQWRSLWWATLAAERAHWPTCCWDFTTWPGASSSLMELTSASTMWESSVDRLVLLCKSRFYSILLLKKTFFTEMIKQMMPKLDKSLRWQMLCNSLNRISKILTRKKFSKRSKRNLPRNLTWKKKIILSSLAFWVFMKQMKRQLELVWLSIRCD